MAENTRRYQWGFRGASKPPVVASRDGGDWCRVTVQTAGTPTVEATAGAMKCLLTSTSEAQSAALYFGDVLAFDIDELIRVEMLVRVSAIAAAQRAVFGLAAAHNATYDSNAAHAWARLEASNALLIETDDGTNDKDDIPTGITLDAAKFYHLAIDFVSAGQTRQPPLASLGRKSNVQFSISSAQGNSQGAHVPIARSTMFDMSNYSAGLQPYIAVQKDSGAGTPSIELLDLIIDMNMPAYG